MTKPDFSLFEENEYWENRNKITKELINLKDALTEKRKANYELFFRKVWLHPGWDSKGWYEEHIFNTPAHHIAELYIMAMRILNSRKVNLEKLNHYKVLELNLEFFLNTELENISTKANEMYGYIIDDIDREIDNAIYGMYREHKTDLAVQALKLLGFCSVISGNLGIEPMKHIKICLINCYNFDEKGIGYTATPVNGKKVKDTAEKGAKQQSKK